MNLVNFLQELSLKGWQLWTEGERLRYRAPEEKITSSVLAQLKQHKAQILQLLCDHPDVLNVYPLSYGQQALYFLWRLAPESYAYNAAFAFRISSMVDISAMKKAFEALIERHPILRTTFPQRGGEPICQVHQNQELDFWQIDASGWNEDELKAKLIEGHQQHFDLEREPVMRVRWFTLSNQEHVLSLTLHHIACDGWSVDLLLQELPQLYQAQKTGVEVSLSPLKHSYQDYVSWQKGILEGTEGEKLWNYWQQKLAGDLPVMNLPTDRPRAPIQTYNGASHHFKLSDKLTKKLKELAGNSGVTLYMMLLAAFCVLLYRYTGQEDILVGSPTSGRSKPEFARLVGYFVDPVVMRANLSNNPSFKEFLIQVRQTVLEALTHQNYPFPLLVEKLYPHRDPSLSPIFQVSFTLQKFQKSQEIQRLFVNDIEEDVVREELKLRPFEIPQQEGQFDLDLEMMEGSSSVFGTFKYNTDLFDGSTIERMAGHFQNLLSTIVENPQVSVAELPLLSEAERHQLLVEWNDTESEYPSDKCIHQLFEEQVERTPDAVAVVFENQRLTYQQLNQRTNQLAHHLQSVGVGLEVLVGICVERSLEMVVGLLGLLKAGAAYVPLDPNYPAERLSYMLADSGVEVLLTQSSLLESLPEQEQQARVVCLDSDWGTIEQQSQENLEVGVNSDNLAYVIYTSGSTGKPKGAMNTHQGFRNRLLWMQEAYQLTSSDRVMQKTPFSFDVSVWEFFWPLLTGARIVVAKPEGHKDSTYLVNLISSQQITTTHFVPSMLQVFLLEPNLENCSCLKRVFCSGEALPVELTQRFFSKFSCELHNLYGPTEAAIDVTFWQCQPQENLQIVPIGRPISNTQIYILDQHLQVAPIGVPGELYIGGDGLARGYLNRPELTGEKFIPNPFSSAPSERLYKTGDLARYLRDGNIEFLGRINNQVKLRGFRIELGEIESVLNTHPQISQALVIAREELPGHKRLVAYVVTSDESLITNQLRKFLKQKLPEYMVPSAFVTLDTLPLTPNGKLDRKALPAPDGEITREQEYVAPRTEIEQTLTNIWQELLLKDKVSIHDNFFEIGGDSILSIQVVSRAKNSGIQITPQQIFQNQTIAELGSVANTTVSVSAQQGIVTGAASLTPIQNWFLEQNRQEIDHYNQSVLLHLPNDIKPELMEKTIKKLLEHHDALRLRFRTQASEHKQINQGDYDTVPFTVVDLSSTPVPSQPQTLEQIATEFQASLNLSDGPLMQVVMFNLGSERDARLLIIIHHLVVDGVSWRILLSDLETIYKQLIAQQPIQLSAKTTAFIDWAEKLNNYAQSEIIKQELDYWLNQPWSKTTQLPLDYAHTHPENTVSSAITYRVKLRVEETRALLGSVNEAYHTQINDLLLSALLLSLAEWTGNSKVLIDLEGHGREELFEDVDLSRTVGWFTSLFPVLLELPTDYQLAEVIKLIKEQLRAIPHLGLGYGILRYLCGDTNVNQQLQTITTPEISFNYLGQFDQVQSSTGWKFAPESTGANQSSKQTRDHLLDINALVVGGELEIDWTYSSNIHNRTTVEHLAQSYVQAIRSIIEHCQSEDAFGYTPSDFPDAQLNQLELDELLAPIKTQNISSIYPLSPMQQGMLFHSLYAPESGVYFEQMTLSLKGNVNVAAFESAWQKVVDRYSILRTFFVWKNRPTPLQVVLKQVNLPWTNLNWFQLSPTEQQQQLSQLLQTQREQGFQLNQAPLMGCTLIKLSDDSYKFIWSHHHILMDGWCLPIIFQEVLSFYKVELQGQTCQLPTPRPYRDYIAWLHSQDQEAASEFWRQTLHGFSAPTPLVVDKTQSQNQQQDSDYQELELRLSPQMSRALQSVAQKHHVTLSTIVQAAWALLLSRYSAEQDVVFGVTVSGRTGSLSGVENMVGLFINTLPLRLQIAPSEQLIPWLQQIQQLMVELQQYSYTPLVDIQTRSEVNGGIPLFESIVVFENYPVDSPLLDEGGSLQLSEIEGFEQTNYPLTVVAVPGDQLLVKISYDTVRFESDTIGRMLGHLQTIFSAIAENPQLSVAELPLLSEAERHQLLTKWNDTVTEYPSDKCIHQLFEEQVEKNHDAIAVVFENQQLTYKQLNQRANQLAHHLQSLGVGPEVLVGICVERSLEMVVGLLGILKAGGAYVPLDPNYPQERLSYMLADSGVEVLLIQQSLLESLPANQAQVVCLDSDWGTIEQLSQENLEVGVSSDNLAYVIYTSGSTGKPKGVLVEHQGLCNLAQAQRNLFDVEPTSRVLQFASVSFDASVSEIFMAVTSGAMLVLGTASELMPGYDLKQILHQSCVTHVTLPPSALAVLSTDELSALDKIIVAGEACSIELVNKWSVGRRFFNAYGPTESTVCATVAQISDDSEKITIGRPIANTQIYILDSHLQPVPIGVPGELYIGGDGLARGYLNRPKLTSEKFIPNVFSDSKSKRLYKTGDLARYLSDGNIEFIGRIDNQLKIRGFRIELEEIESVVNTHPQIQQAVVIATEELFGNKRLVVYVVREDESLSIKQLREFLKQKLPEYMVPSAFVTLDTLPLTPNGKVNRKALPAPDGKIIRENEYVATRTQNEEIIANIFANVLSVQNVGIHDNFFELGGHSLLAICLMSEIQQQFQKNLPLATLFQNPTVEQLANLIRSSVNILNSILVPIKTSGNKTPLFCIHPVGGNVLCYADLASYLDRDYPVYGLQSLGLDGQQPPITSVEEMAFHYIEAIQQVQPEGPYNLIGWSMGGVIAYEMAQQLEAKNEPVALLTLIDSYTPTVISLPSEIDEAMIVNQLAQDWGGLYGQDLDIPLETLRKLESPEQVKHLFEQAKQQAIFPPEIEIEHIQNLWKVFQTNLIAMYHYQPKTYSGSIILLNASETPPEVIKDPTQGWGSLVLSDIQTHTITGDHYTIIKVPQVKCLTEKLNGHLKLIQSQQDRD
ncbi:MAG: amino acid adenylation domain-containing protein [Symploca sp. SIO2D2]|nr:amino acid adenylation domain-containing protein [Symploca sp. SIO2D2]